MISTPIWDFVAAYQAKGGLRLHMPGHKGRAMLGPEAMDITEIAGADELYHPRGIIRESEENAASLFGAARTCYSTEGSSLCIRAMVYLSLLHGRAQGRRPLLLAGRNAHKAFLSACALLDAEVSWLYPEGESSLIACPLSADGLQKGLTALPEKPAAVYVTSPDYLGNQLDIAALAAVCHAQDTPLVVDNAHGAYLKFLETDQHPLTLGADLCCDSAHKTFPVLTGGAYLHIGKNAPAAFAQHADRALALFASSSPSYLILQSLDQCNLYLSQEYPGQLAALAGRMNAMKERLSAQGWLLQGNEPCKLTLAPKRQGYTGDGLHALLRKQNMEWEFSDPDFLTAMLTPEISPTELNRLEETLLSVPRRSPIPGGPPAPPRGERVLSLRQAMLFPCQEIPVEEAVGRVLSSAHLSCPPCVPILAPGERIDRAAVDCFHYYGIETCAVTA